MKFVLIGIAAAVLYAAFISYREAEVVFTKELGPIEAVSGGSWTTRVQVGGTNFPLVGNVTVTKGTMVVLQMRASDDLFMCDAATKAQCFKVRESWQALGRPGLQRN